MTPEHAVLLIALGFGAGIIGALGGIGGGIIVIPVLAVYFGLPMHQAIGTSLVAVIATSTATSSVYVEQGFADIRLGMTLELATTFGAAVAAFIAGFLDRRTLAILFSVFLTYTAIALLRRAWSSRQEQPMTEVPDYHVENYPAGMASALAAGGLSGLLGIGGGPIKVPIMLLFMKVPLRVATATSNFMIGVTAATSAFVYFGRGDIPITIAAVIVVGVFTGSLVGARIGPKVRGSYILWLLTVVIGYLAVQMIIKLFTGGFA